MSEAIAIAAERPGDAAAIADIVRRAYAAVPYSDHREHVMIERLRETDAFLPALSLIARMGGVPVGHILATIATIEGAQGTAATLALAPLSVVPDRQGAGVGSALVAALHARAAALGFASILLVGLPGYYRRFGYEPLARYPITLPFDAPAPDRMILALRPGALDGVSGRVRYAEGWLDH